MTARLRRHSYRPGVYVGEVGRHLYQVERHTAHLDEPAGWTAYVTSDPDRTFRCATLREVRRELGRRQAELSATPSRPSPTAGTGGGQ